MTDKAITPVIDNPPAITDTVTEETISIAEMITLRNKHNPPLSYQQIADLIGCSKANVIQRLKPYRDELNNLEAYKSNRADIYALVGSKIVNEITESDIQKAPLQTKVWSIGVLHDKEQGIRDKQVKSLDYKAMVNDIKDLEDQEADLDKELDAILVGDNDGIEPDNTPDTGDLLPLDTEPHTDTD